LSNAVKFTNQGKVSLIASTGQDRLHVQVRDTGIGIPEEHLGSVFNSFHQVDNSTTRKFGGTGLGLAICRDLAKAMGGTITVESKHGEGSTFTLDIPFLRESSPQAGTELAPATILVCEANVLARSMISAALQSDGSKVIHAAPDSLTSQSQTPGLVAAILDTESMGGIDAAIGLVGDIRRSVPQLPIIILATTDMALSHGQLLRAAGANQVLSRPLPPPALVAALHALVPELTSRLPDAERAAA
jgi:CheY-like chemotaxis protein